MIYIYQFFACHAQRSIKNKFLYMLLLVEPNRKLKDLDTIDNSYFFGFHVFNMKTKKK